MPPAQGKRRFLDDVFPALTAGRVCENNTGDHPAIIHHKRKRILNPFFIAAKLEKLIPHSIIFFHQPTFPINFTCKNQILILILNYLF
jgi:hypothetical protein